MKKHRFDRSEYGVGSVLPINFNSDPSVDWWNPPEDQEFRFSRDLNNVRTIFVWEDNTVYVAQSGDF